MSKGYFFNLPAHGHINPTLPLTRELVQRGESIVYYTGEGERTKIATTGAEFRPIPYDLNAFSKRPQSPAIDFLLFDCALKCLPALIETARQEEPDYVLYDFVCPWGKILGEYLGVPTIGIFPNPVPVVEMLPPSIVFKIIDYLVPLGRKVCRMRDEIAARYHREPESLIQFLTNPDRELGIVMTSEIFQPQRQRLGKAIKFVGPCYPDLPNPPEFPMEALTGKQVIYATLGTVYGQNRSFFDKCIEAFHDVDCIVVISTGNGIDPSAFTHAPKHFIIKKFVPQWEILERASLFITHGGMNSIHAGLYHGVPMIVMPQGIATDQHGNAQTIERQGAGVRFNGKLFRPAGLRKAALHLMSNPQTKAQLKRLQTEFRRMDAPVRGADEIIRHVQRRQPVEAAAVG